LGWDLFQFLRDSFTINVEIVSDKTLRERERERERERGKNKGLEDNTKTRVCRLWSCQQTLGGVIHLGETLLGLSLLVTGRDWDFG